MKKLWDLLNKYLKIALIFVNEKIIKKIKKGWQEYSEELAYEIIYYYEKSIVKYPKLVKAWKNSRAYSYYSKYLEKYISLSLKTVKENLRLFFVALAFIILFIGYLNFNENTYHSYLFYTDKKKSSLFAEKRSIVKNFKEIERVKNSIEELLLGPIDPKLVNIFPIEAKLLSAKLVKGELILNFNKETIMNVNWEKNGEVSIYKLIVYSIADTIFIQFKNINKIKFYFNGEEYRYIGDIGPIDGGIKADWKLLKK